MAYNIYDVRGAYNRGYSVTTGVVVYEESPSGNSSRIGVWFDLHAGSQAYFSGHALNGGFAWYVNGVYQGGWSPAGQYSMPGFNSYIRLYWWEGWVGHNERGQLGMSSDGWVQMQNQGFSYSLPYVAVAGSGSGRDYDRRANKAGPPVLTRSSDGKTMYYSVTDPGAQNGGPQRDFEWDYAEKGAASWSDLATTDGNSGSVAVNQFKTYIARVRAYNIEGDSGWSDTSADSYGIPSQVTNIKAVASTTTTGNITISWDAPVYTGGTITKYEVYRGATRIRDSGTTREHVDTGRTPGTEYEYTVYAFNATGQSPVSATVSAIALGTPSAVNNFAVTRSTTTAFRILLTWSLPSYIGNGIIRYNVYRDNVKIGEWSGQATPTSINPFVDDIPPRGISHDYKVEAVNSNGAGTMSATLAAVAPGIPSAPSSITSPAEDPTLKVGRSVTIEYSQDSNGYGNNILGYYLQFSTDDGSTWHGWNNDTKTRILNGENQVFGGSFTYQLLTPALTYKWRVYAKNSVGSGDQTRVTPTGTFVSSGGRRYIPETSQWKPTEIAKRYGIEGASKDQTVKWWDIVTAKRWNGTSWEDLK